MKIMNMQILILFLILTGFQAKQDGIQTNDFKSKKSGIILNQEIIKPFDGNEISRPDNPDFDYYRIKDFAIDLNKNQKPDSIILYRLKGWENDPGDFHQIVIKMDDGYEWKGTNFNGWVRFDNNYSVPNQVKEKNQIDTDLLLQTDFYSTKVLGLFGWAYASQPGLLTIIEFSTNKPRVMLNENWRILKIDSSIIKADNYNDKFQIELINNKIEVTKE